ncbi:MAG TPA: transposase family protein [Cyclobacteriaceae bacterium]|nr:transposase family protein [Cyclobacteriaceae bacterium]HMV07450.1 transposase family protein [Cyclobacteriaceae bacterium]HMW99195.1 transposase family protein [Cyclobacteriaceae bacterium]HMX48172.1 transposase family protein [Cyclobacteriaceae bacterium]HMY94977.1 transposase family protein [Cyclobacteriaceae bacterium]
MLFINFPTGALLTEKSDDKKFYRILNVDRSSDLIYLFPIIKGDKKNRLPIKYCLSEIEKKLKSRELRYAAQDYFDNSHIEKVQCSDSEIEILTKAFSVIELLTQSSSVITNVSYRNSLINKLVNERKASKPSMYKWMAMFWRGNMNWQSLVPSFKNCGAPGKEKGTSKFNSATQKLLENKYKEYHLRSGLSIEGTISKIVREDLDESLHCHGDLITPKALIYHGEKNLSSAEKLELQMGPRGFTMTSKMLKGRATDGVIGPLDLVQIDWTQMDIQLRSSVFKDHFLGRPYLYIVTDTTSRYVLGFLITFYTPSYATLTNALLNACVPLNEFDDEEFTTFKENCDHLRLIPRRVVADRGEALSEKADDIAQSLGIVVENTEAYRGDLKPIVERLVKTVQDRIKEIMHGKGVVGQDHGERQAEDSREYATITLEKLIEIVKIIIREYNRDHLIKTYPLQKGMDTSFVDKIPVKIVQWGLQEGTTFQTSKPLDTLRLHLLTKEQELSGSRKGIILHGDEYIPVDEETEKLYQELISAGENEFTLAYDPRRYHEIYWYYEGKFHLTKIRGENMAVYPTLYDRLVAKAEYSVKDNSQKKEERKARIRNDIEIAKILASAEQENYGKLNMNLGKELQSIEKHLEQASETAILNESKENEEKSGIYSRPTQSDEISKLYEQD